MYDDDYIYLEALASNYSTALQKFKKEWFEPGLGKWEYPTLEVGKTNDEFIIQVPRANNKAQYLPFIYGGLTVEILI